MLFSRLTSSTLALRRSHAGPADDAHGGAYNVHCQVGRFKYVLAVTDHLGNIFWDSIINRWLVEAFSSSSYVNWIEWMDNYVCVVGLDRIG